MALSFNLSLALRCSNSLQTLVAMRSFATKSSVENAEALRNKLAQSGAMDIKSEPGYVIVNGRRYQYPYPGIFHEYNYLQLLDKWRAEGKLDRDSNPRFSKMKGREKILAKQLWFQRDPSMPVHMLGKYDRQVNSVLVLIFILGVMMTSIYGLYRVTVDPKDDVFNYQYYDRLRKEHKEHKEHH